MDEREILLFIQTGNIATIVYMSLLVGLFFLQNSVITFIGEPLKEFWVFYIVPLFSLSHSLTGFIIIMIDNRRMEN